MSQGKYIGTKEATQLTGLSTQEIYDLIHNGTLPAHKAPKSGWRISYQTLADLGLIKEIPKPISEKPQIENGVFYVTDEEHYTQVFKLMTEVKHSLKIASANLKNFNVPIESDDAPHKTLRLCDFFFSLVNRGVRVQIVCMKPFGFYLYAKENCPQLLENPFFELRCNERNHMKVFIFDDECAYIGSANITNAAIGKRASGNRNHEAGILLRGADLIQSPLHHFDSVFNAPNILKSSWKRFATKAKALDKDLKERFG